MITEKKIYCESKNKSYSVKIDCHSDKGKGFYVHYCSGLENDDSCFFDKTDFNQLIICLDDKLKQENRDNIASCRMGDCLICREGENCNMENYFKGECLKLDFPVDAFDGIEGSGIFVDVFDNHELNEGNILRTDSDGRDRIVRISKKIIAVLGEDIKSRLMTYSYIIQLMNVIDNAFKERKFICIGDKMPNVVFEAIQYIYTNLSSIRTIKEIAENVNVSMSYLARLFKHNLGCSPYEYLVDKRIENAKILMCYLGYSVTDACEEVGFSDYSSFASAFKKKTGVTPYAYKKNHL